MIENIYKYDFGGFKYEHHTHCLGEEAYYIRPDGKREKLPIHGQFMDASDAIKIHAMNSNGYSP